MEKVNFIKVLLADLRKPKSLPVNFLGVFDLLRDLQICFTKFSDTNTNCKLMWLNLLICSWFTFLTTPSAFPQRYGLKYSLWKTNRNKKTFAQLT